MEAKLGDSDEARRLFRRAEAANGRNAATFQAWAVMEARLERFDDAAALFERALRENPSSTYSMQAYALMEARRGSLDKALELFKRGFQPGLRDAALLQACGVLLFRAGNDTASAREMFRRAVAIDARHCASWQAWALMEAKLGRFEEARRLFQQGAWAGVGETHVARIWQAWALLEVSAPARASSPRVIHLRSLP